MYESHIQVYLVWSTAQAYHDKYVKDARDEKYAVYEKHWNFHVGKCLLHVSFLEVFLVNGFK